jgi:alpha-beta hydrolase superfamily lysophospholipase
MRALPLLFAMLLLAGCAGQAPRAVAPLAAPRLEANFLVADDGAKLPLRRWLPDGPPKAVILALHGFNDYSHAFAMPGKEWALDGIATYAYDQRGFGEAPERGLWVGSARLAEDFAQATRLLRRRYPGTPLFCLGESMGGAVVAAAEAGDAGTAEKPDCDGIILSAPAVWGRDTMNVFERVALWTGDRLFPSMTLTGRGLHILASDNIPMLIALGRDPLVIKATRVDTIDGLVDLMDRAQAAAPEIKSPMLLLYGAHDQLVPLDATERFIDHLPYAARATRKIAWYQHGYHMLLRDLDGRLVWRDVESWIADARAPLPSGADLLASRVLYAGGAGGRRPSAAAQN